MTDSATEAEKNFKTAIKEYKSAVKNKDEDEKFYLLSRKKHKVNNSLYISLLNGNFFEDDQEGIENLYEILNNFNEFLKNEKGNLLTRIEHIDQNKKVFKSFQTNYYQQLSQLSVLNKKERKKYGEENFIKFLFNNISTTSFELKIADDTKQSKGNYQIPSETTISTSEKKENNIIFLEDHYLEYQQAKDIDEQEEQYDIRDLQGRIESYDIFIEELIEFLKNINESLHGNSEYVPLSPNKYLAKLLDNDDGKYNTYSFRPIAFLLKFWELECKTLVDHEYYGGFRHLKRGIKNQIKALEDTKDFAGINGPIKKQQLLSLYYFLMGKYGKEKADKDKELDCDRELTESLNKKYVIACNVFKVIKEIVEKKEKGTEEVKVRKILNGTLEELMKEGFIDKENIQEVREKLEKIKNLSGHDNSISDLFLALQWHKNVAKRFSEQDKVEYLEHVKKLIELCKNHNTNFFRNNKMSYLVDYYDKNEEILFSKAAANDIDSSMGEEPDHFSFYLKAKFYYLRAKQLLEKKEADDEVQESFNKALNFIKDAEVDYYAEDQFSYLFVPFKELSMETEVFSYSSFFPYYKYPFQQKIAKLKRQMDTLQLQILTAQIAAQRNIFSNTVEQKTEELRKHTIEILAIFSAVALFALSNVEIYTNVTSARAAVALTFAFGSVLLLFAFALFALFGAFRRRITKWQYVMFSMLFVLFIILFFFSGMILVGKIPNFSLHYPIATPTNTPIKKSL